MVLQFTSKREFPLSLEQMRKLRPLIIFIHRISIKTMCYIIFYNNIYSVQVSKTRTRFRTLVCRSCFFIYVLN